MKNWFGMKFKLAVLLQKFTEKKKLFSPMASSSTALIWSLDALKEFVFIYNFTKTDPSSELPRLRFPFRDTFR